MSPSDRRPDSQVKAERRRPQRPGRLGFNHDQWRYIQVLVANWIFAAIWFVGAKQLIDWEPSSWVNLEDKFGLVLKCATFAILPALIAIAVVAWQRLDPNMWVGRNVRPNSALDINTRFILNTFEQFTLYFVGHATMVLYAPQVEARVFPILTALFLLGRVMFWYGYHKNQLMRAFGFGITFYPTMMVFVWLMFRIVFDIHIKV